jgi:hypothetical protein
MSNFDLVLKLFFQLAIDDVRDACDVLRPVYDAANGQDGFVSLEVDPNLAFDGEALFFADGALWILTKHRRDTGTTLYRLADVEGGAEQTLEPLQQLALPIESAPFGTVTAASASADGRLVAVLLYQAIFVYERRADGTLDPQPRARIALDPRRTGQVEGITWNGRALLFSNEPGDLFRIPDPLDPALDRYPP